MEQKAKGKLMLRDLFQVSVAVRDVDRTAEYYSSLGLGPFQIRDSESRGNVKVRGKPAWFKYRLGFARLGPVQLELIQPLEGQSIAREFLEARGEGLHHLAFAVDDIKGELAKLEETGVSVLMGNESFAYLDTGEVGGVVLELIDSRVAAALPFGTP